MLAVIYANQCEEINPVADNYVVYSSDYKLMYTVLGSHMWYTRTHTGTPQEKIDFVASAFAPGGLDNEMAMVKVHSEGK